MGNPLFLPGKVAGKRARDMGQIGPPCGQGAFRFALLLECFVQICDKAIVLDGIHHTYLPPWPPWNHNPMAICPIRGGVSEDSGMPKKWINVTISYEKNMINHGISRGSLGVRGCIQLSDKSKSNCATSKWWLAGHWRSCDWFAASRKLHFWPKPDRIWQDSRTKIGASGHVKQ
jgi:hypothetical protein